MKILEAIHNQSPIASKRISSELKVLLQKKNNSNRTESEMILLITAITPFVSNLVQENFTDFLPLCFEAIRGNSSVLQGVGFVALENSFRNLSTELRSSLCQELIAFMQVSKILL